MRWKKREKMLRELRRRHGDRHRAPMPDLRCDGPRYPSLSDTGVAAIVETKAATPVNEVGLIVDTLHKQGPMVLSRDELPWAGGRKP